MRKRLALTLVLALCACACLFGLAACGTSDHEDLQGEWQVDGQADGTVVTVVFTQDELKMVGETFGYTIDESEQTISYTSGDEAYGSASYSFSDDRQTLTLTEDDGNGGTTTTTFTKLSDDTSAEPSATVESTESDESDESADDETDESADDESAESE